MTLPWRPAPTFSAVESGLGGGARPVATSFSWLSSVSANADLCPSGVRSSASDARRRRQSRPWAIDCSGFVIGGGLSSSVRLSSPPLVLWRASLTPPSRRVARHHGSIHDVGAYCPPVPPSTPNAAPPCFPGLCAFPTLRGHSRKYALKSLIYFPYLGSLMGQGRWPSGCRRFRVPVFSACSFGAVKDSVRCQQTQASPRIVWPYAGRCRNTVATSAPIRRTRVTGRCCALKMRANASDSRRTNASMAPAHAHSGAKGGALRCVDANVRGQQYN